MTLWRARASRQTNGADGRRPSPSRLLSLRSAVVLVFSCAVGLATGWLTMAVQPHPATAIIAGGTALGAAVKFFDGIIGEV